MSLPNETVVLPEVPILVEALTRIEILLGLNGGMEFLSVFIARIYVSLESEEYQRAAITPLFELCQKLYELRQEVLKLIPRETRHKNQQLNVVLYSDGIASLIFEYVRVTDKLIYKQESALQ